MTFVDTNLFVYLFDRTDPAKSDVCHNALDRLGQDVVLSTQVLSEFLNSVGRERRGGSKLLDDLSARAAVEGIIARYRVVELAAQDIVAAARLREAMPISLWDAQIVAVAARAGCDTLLTEDLQHGQTIEGVAVRSPFRAAG